ncbi:unnamed protein product [Polarella glacialis]|uniref:Uncharacterized protein n=1 Tax=Polarella glacialis TaxID=89957 RepID=A0A813IIR2_POLGL|nr:unnamed protein product [Polarella glacialis]
MRTGATAASVLHVLHPRVPDAGMVFAVSGACTPVVCFWSPWGCQGEAAGCPEVPQRAHSGWGRPEAAVAASTVAVAVLLTPRGRRCRRLCVVGRCSAGSVSRKASVKEVVVDLSGAVGQAELLKSLGAEPDWLSPGQECVENLQLLRGWQPVTSEAFLKGLRVRGEVPKHLEGGVFLRNGPNQALAPFSMQDYHVFDGHGMLHAVHFHRGGAADYRRRYVRSKAFVLEQAEGQSLYTGMRNMLPRFPRFLRCLYEKFAGSGGRPDSPYWVVQNRNPANNGCTVHAGRVLATWEAGSAYEVRLPDLATLGLCQFNGSLADSELFNDNCSAHGKVDPQTGELVTISYNMIESPPWIRVFTVGSRGAILKRVKVVLPTGPALLHDFAITASRVVLNVGPLNLVPAKMISGEPPFDFDFSAKCYFGILDRRAADDSAEVVWIKTEECCFNFHVLNAYDHPSDPNLVVLHTFRQDYTLGLGMGSKIREELRHSPHGQMLQGDTAVLHRWVLDVKAARVVESVRLHASPAAVEQAASGGGSQEVAATKSLLQQGTCWLSDFGAVNPNRVGRQHRFGWSLAFEASVQLGAPVPDGEVARFTRVLKHDLVSGELIEHDLRFSSSRSSNSASPEGRFVCSDLVVVPESSDQEATEDAASVLVLVHDLQESTAELRVLNAATLELQCAVEIPIRVPLGFHCGFAEAGSWSEEHAESHGFGQFQ